MSVEKLSYDHCDLVVFDIDGEEYAVAISDEEADKAAAAYIKDSLWTFNTEFIINHSKLPQEATEMLRVFQENKCEGANETIAALIEDMDEFISDAIAADGRGRFLSHYDGKEKPLNELDKKYWGQVLGALGLHSKDLSSVILYRLN